MTGFSEAQWTSLLLMFGAAIAERLGTLPVHAWHELVLATMALAMAAIALVRGLCRSAAQLHPKHLKEIALAVRSRAAFTAAPDQNSPRGTNRKPIRLACTSQSLQISAGVIRRSRQIITHFSLSRATSPLTSRDATKLTRLFAQFLDSSKHCRVLPGNSGVVHLLFIREELASARHDDFPRRI